MKLSDLIGKEIINHSNVKPDAIIEAIIARLHECVKPLEWEEPHSGNNWIYVARSPWGDYGIHIDGGRHRAWLEAHVKPYERWLGDDDVGSVYEAQDAAQAHYAAQIVGGLNL